MGEDAGSPTKAPQLELPSELNINSGSNDIVKALLKTVQVYAAKCGLNGRWAVERLHPLPPRQQAQVTTLRPLYHIFTRAFHTGRYQKAESPILYKNKILQHTERFKQAYGTGCVARETSSFFFNAGFWGW